MILLCDLTLISLVICGYLTVEKDHSLLFEKTCINI